KIREPGATRQRSRDGCYTEIGFRKLDQRIRVDLGISRRRGRIGLASLSLVGAEAMKFSRICEGRAIAAAFVREDMEDDRLILRFQKFENPDERRKIMSVDWSIVAQPKLFEYDAWQEQILRALLDLARQ